MSAFLNTSLSAIPVWVVDAPTTTVDDSLSGTISLINTAATIPFASAHRQEVINASTATLWARWGASPVVNGAGSFPILSGGSYALSGVSGTLYLLSTAANQTFTVVRFISG